MFKTLLLTFVCLVCQNEAAKILAYYPMASISHQVVFRPLTMELVKRGHEVVVITTDPIYPKGGGPDNLQEIDLHDLSYSTWRKMILENQNKFNRNAYEKYIKIVSNLVEQQIKTSEVQKLLQDKSKSFDLVIIQAFVDMALGLGYHYKAPIILFSPLASTTPMYKVFGAATHPLLYPSPLHEKLYNLTIQEKIGELYHEYTYGRIIPNNLEFYESFGRRVFGDGIPPFQEMLANLDMLFLNVHSVWDSNRPVPPNVIYLGGLHQKTQKDLPQDIQTYLDSSKNGVIYVSFGSNVDPTLFSSELVQTFVNVFSKLPYDVLWKWNGDELPGRTPNIRISKWLPQSDMLRHPNLKLFITQGGLQSTDEAITAGVPLVGIPVFGDQKFNTEQYLHFKIGEKVELAQLTEDKLSTAINKVLSANKSYRDNAAKLRSIMNDQPQSPLERAVWWTEYVIRHKGAKHLRSPTANMSLAEYLELELVSYLVLGLLLVLSTVVGLVYFVYSAIFKHSKKVKKN